MAYGNHRGWVRILRAFGYSWNGLRSAFRHEEAFRQELLLCLVLVPAAFLLTDVGVERALLLGSLILILIVELLNSGIEAAIDRFGGELHALSARAKDMGSAAVLLSFVNAVVVWLLVVL
ncbi:Diacylglycerol kinase [Thioalkalivibrio nitratireducens DSM 14787]|uniref:Diacylglycerol kinase n=1 Tax=Thioalkalivibrio nitratireducens (strain DSM 14787 / UNIQEM 213 / ALEN2) TaxID=1255043 RepID=L0DUQ4_THIND|nr:diacylglycerol kinase [Thioalkalivibrio nitratireducens]AGA32753.1 Diacylglycerol kinase [Thioalkalivibrio nitratireducens DSM 14787]